MFIQLTTSGQPFWSGPKRCPEAIIFDPKNDLHTAFIEAATYLFAENYGLKGTWWAVGGLCGVQISLCRIDLFHLVRIMQMIKIIPLVVTE